MAHALHGLALTSLLVSLLIALFLPLRPMLRRIIGSQWLCLLWLAVLARLLMPWTVESRWSMFNRWQGHAAPAAAVAHEPVKIKVSVVENATPQHYAAIANDSTPDVPAPSRHEFSLEEVLNMLWLSGFASSLCILAWRWRQTCILASGARPATNERLLHIFSSIPQKWRGNVELKMTDTLQVPTLAGIIRPQIWMPQSWPAQFSDDELRNVLLHELGHARRRDLLAQWLFALAQCIHWFNPLVWLAARAARFDREMACDAWVLARSGADSAGYGAALMKTVQLLRDPLCAIPATVAMASSRRNLFTRIRGIGAFQPMPAWRGVAGIAVMIAALTAATTSSTPAQEAARTDDKNTTPQPSTPAAPGPSSKQFIDVQSKYVVITEETWKKLCAENPDFKGFAGKFPELDRKKAPLADLVKELNNLQKGAWEVPAGEIKLLKSFSREDMQKTIGSLKNEKGVKLLSGPSVTTRSGRDAVIEITTEFRYPTAFKPNAQASDGVTPTEFTTKNLGVTLAVKPTINRNGTIDAELTPTVAGFLGFQQEKNGARIIESLPDYKLPPAKPVFSTSTVTTSVNIPSSRTILLGGVRLDNQTDDTGDGTDTPSEWSGMSGFGNKSNINPETVRHILLVFVTADIVAPPAPVVSPAPTALPPTTPVPAAKGAAVTSGTQIALESKFVQITEEAWEKLAKTEDFKQIASHLPGMDGKIKSYAELEQELSSGPDGPRNLDSSMSLLGVFSQKQLTGIIGGINKTAGIDLLAAPTVTSKNGQKAVIEVIYEFRYATKYEPDKKSPIGVSPTEFKTKNIGVTLNVQPTANKDETIDLELTPELTTFLGFLQDKDGKRMFIRQGQNLRFREIEQPVFFTSGGKTDVSAWNGQTVLLGGIKLEVKAGGDPHTERHVVLVFVTPKIIDPNAPASIPFNTYSGPNSYSGTTTIQGGTLNLGTAAPAPAGGNPDAQIPYGIPVKGKEGFVTSPYSPEAGMIDVRGFKPGVEVRDPYSGKIFLAP